MLITAVMFQAQNRETINSTRKIAVSFIMTTRVEWQDRVSQQSITLARPRPRPRPIFGLRPVLS